jgi:hypothetical protein
LAALFSAAVGFSMYAPSTICVTSRTFASASRTRSRRVRSTIHAFDDGFGATREAVYFRIRLGGEVDGRGPAGDAVGAGDESHPCRVGLHRIEDASAHASIARALLSRQSSRALCARLVLVDRQRPQQPAQTAGESLREADCMHETTSSFVVVAARRLTAPFRCRCSRSR